MEKRVGIFWLILTTITFVIWCYKGFNNPGGTLICYCAIIYYGENILNKLKDK